VSYSPSNVFREPDFISGVNKDRIRKPGNTRRQGNNDRKGFPNIGLQVKHSELIIPLVVGEPKRCQELSTATWVSRCEVEREGGENSVILQLSHAKATKLPRTSLCEPYRIVRSYGDSLNERVACPNRIGPVQAIRRSSITTLLLAPQNPTLSSIFSPDGLAPDTAGFG